MTKKILMREGAYFENKVLRCGRCHSIELELVYRDSVSDIRHTIMRCKKCKQRIELKYKWEE